MTLFCRLISTFLLLLSAALGAGLASTVPGDWSRDDYPMALHQLDTQSLDLASASRAPPQTGGNVAATDSLLAGTGGVRVFYDVASLGDVSAFSHSSIAPNKIPAAKQPIVGDPKLENLMDNIYKGTSNPNRVGDGTLADAVRYENATGGTVGGRTHTIKAQETIRGLQNWLDRNSHALQADRQEAITQIQNLKDALGS